MRLKCPEPRALDVLLLDNVVIDPGATPFVDLVGTTEPENLLVFYAVFRDRNNCLRRGSLVLNRRDRFLLLLLMCVLIFRRQVLFMLNLGLWVRMINCLCLSQTAVLPLVLQLLGYHLVLYGLYVPKLLTYPRRKTFHQPHRVHDLRIDVDTFARNLAIGVEHRLMWARICLWLIPFDLLKLLLLLHVLYGSPSYATRCHRVLVRRKRVP